MRLVWSLIVWVLCFLVLIVLGTPFLILSLFDSGGARVYGISVQYMRSVVFLVGLKISAGGQEKVPSGTTYIVMANHRSWWDIPAVMIGCWPMQLRFVAKKELADMPLFGLCVRQGGHVLIDRNDRDSAIRTMRDSARRFAGRFSIVVFPEGTRSPDHRLLRFKRGGFHLSRELNIPIVPVSVVGGERIMRRGSINLYPGRMRVQFGAPIHPADYPDMDRLTEEVRRRIGEGLAGMGEFEPDHLPPVGGAGTT
ncbi:MAG: lysophospholipid acyltransferase family protein [Candidatus Eisenbacteria bacterium]|nr:lysophospholipid acyltransferase family protein [Candidatus Eisenbacteria bacterium]